MSTFRYHIEFKSGYAVYGKRDDPQGELHISELAPEDNAEIDYVSAEMHLNVEDEEKIFMNGFQTWTYCPEFSTEDKIRGVQGLPKFLVRKFGIDRYGDYYFREYPNKKGITHGVSWCYFHLGDRYRLIASLDERPGYTYFTYDANRAVLSMSRDCSGLKISGEYSLFDLFFAEGTEDEVFDAWFDAMEIKPRTDKKTAGYSSWYNRYEDIDEASVRGDLAGCAGVLHPGDLFQIDDGWEENVGDWLEADTKKFPCGMKAMADAVHGQGFEAGLWLAPFVCNTRSAVYREHPDWLLKVDGKPWNLGCNWGGFWALDIDNPEVTAYLEKVFDKVFNEWGFDLVKLDFLYGAAPFGTDRETRAGRMYRAMELLRRLCGDKKILGCGVPVMPAFGIVDYCRVSCDVGLDWNNSFIMQHTNRERVSTKQAIENSVFRRQLNGRAYLSDPDVFFLRDKNIRLSADEKDTLATACALFGGVFLSSDDMSEYSDDKKAAYEAYRHLRDDAKIVSVDAEEGLSVTFMLDGEEHRLVIKE